MFRVINIVVIFLVCVTARAQQEPDADKMFLDARDAAFNERLAEARVICRELLSYYPDYYDAVILIGRTYAWELKTDSARMTILPLLDIEPDNYDVLTLLADNEIWGGRYGNGRTFIDQALMYYPSDEEFIFKKANTYYLQKDNNNAIKLLHELLDLNPDNAAGNDLLNTILPPLTLIEYLYDRAEKEANAGNWRVARMYCRNILQSQHEHYATSLLMAQTFAFENEFDSARIISSKLYDIDPNNYEVLDLLVNIEIWSRKYKYALVQVDKALAAYPYHENFLFKKAQILYLYKDYKNALTTIEELLVKYPNHKEGNVLKKDIMENHRYRDYTFIDFYFEYFKKSYKDRKLLTSTGISKWTRDGTYIVKINTGAELPVRLPAMQYELEVYRKLFPSNYLNVNYAWSQNNFFPNHRGVVEFFQRLPKGFEGSLGVRVLYWDDVHWLYTGSISWLNNKNYLAFRPFFSYENSHLRNTYILTYRRYFSNREDYMFALLGYGNYSDSFLHLNPNPANSYIVQIGILKFLTVNWFFHASAGYTYDNDYRNRYITTAGIRYYFNMFN